MNEDQIKWFCAAVMGYIDNHVSHKIIVDKENPFVEDGRTCYKFKEVPFYPDIEYFIASVGHYVESFTEQHFGDCTNVACSCQKCRADGRWAEGNKLYERLVKFWGERDKEYKLPETTKEQQRERALNLIKQKYGEEVKKLPKKVKEIYMELVRPPVDQNWREDDGG